MANPPVNKNHPDRALVESIAGEEAAAACIGLSHVLGMSRAPQAVKARHRAWKRILADTGCSVNGLAEVWGCYGNAITYALGRWEQSAAPKPLYDRQTVERLTSRHGAERASQIVAGVDPATLQDIAAWRSLGNNRSAA